MKYINLKILSIFSLLVSIFLSGNQEKIVEVDRYLSLSKMEAKNRYFNNAYELSKKAYEESSRIDYKEGLNLSKISFARNAIEIGKYAEALEKLNEVDYEFLSQDQFILSEYHVLKGAVYYHLNMFTIALNEFNEYKEHKLDDQSRLEVLDLEFWANYFVSDIYINLENIDKASLAIYNMEKIVKLNKQDSHSPFELLTLMQLSKLYARANDFVKAESLLQKAFYLTGNVSITYKHLIYEELAKIELKKNNYIAANDYYNKALNNSLEYNYHQKSYSYYNLIKKFNFDNEISNNNLDKNIDKYVDFKTFKDDLDSKNHLEESHSIYSHFNYIHYILFSVFLVAKIILLVLMFRIKNKLYKNDKNESLEIDQNQTETKEVDFEKVHLLMELAKENSPEFLLVFKDVYPEFIDKMKEFDENIRNSELIFCSLTFLNFSTKEIAQYTFVTPRAVQIRKNRLRKKYNIPSDVDFNSWMRDLTSHS